MKKLYLLAAAALCAATATAANGDVTDGWLMLEDFEGTTPTLSTFKTDGSGVGTGTSEVAVYTSKDGNVDNHVGKFTANNARTDGFLLTVALPAGKTIADYTAIKLDLVGINTQYKNLDLYIDGNNLYTQSGNPIGGQGSWNTHSHDITVTGGNTITIGFYNYLGNGDQVAFDNIQLKEKDGGSGENPNPDPDPTPGDYDASKNGTVVDGYYMAEDFQNNALNDAIGTGSYYGGNGAGGSAKVEVDSKAATNLIAHGTFSNSDWNTMFALDITLQDGKTLKDYTAIAFDLYRFNADGGNRQIYVKAGNQEIKSPGKEEEIKTGEWLHYEYSIPENSSVGNSFKLYLGIKALIADYAIDNIRFKIADSSEDPDPDPTPGDYDESKNGTVTDGWLMIEDYQTKQLGEEATVGDYYGGDVSGISAKIEVDPKKATNLVARATLTGSGWNTVFALDVVLPEGTTLKDYSAIAFDIYRFTAPEGNRQIYVKAGNYEIKPAGDYEEIKTGEWITKEYAISENTQVGNSFKLYFGIKSSEANYAVDNIRLKAKETPKPELEVVGEPEITIKHGTAAGIMTVSYSFDLKNHNGEEIKVVASVEGHDEVVFDKSVAETANVQALAANENKTFKGNLKAQHDVLKTINNPNVILTATAGEKQLFTIKKTPDNTTGIEDVTVDSEAPVEYFNLQGLRVAQPEAGRLYIKRQGDKAVKVRF